MKRHRFIRDHVSAITAENRTYFLRLALLFLIMVSIGQASWWYIDQTTYVDRNMNQIADLYENDLKAAEQLIKLGSSRSEIENVFPHLKVTQKGVEITSDILSKMEEERFSRLNMYGWEGSFFIIVLIACVIVIWNALRTESRIRKSQDNFLSMVCHEFKTPLASLQLSVETITVRHLESDELKLRLQRMLDDLQRMEDMVSKILDTARLEQGRVRLSKETIRLDTAVSHVVDDLSDRIQRSYVTINTEIPPNLLIFADPLALDTVLRNLIENAISAMQPLDGGNVVIRGQAYDGVVELKIQDAGVGFEPVERHKLFDKFFRTERNYGGHKSGTGLGLFIVRRLMQLEDGEVRGQSAGLGKGAAFTLAWPAMLGENQ